MFRIWTLVGPVRRGRHDLRPMTLVPGDPLAHRALESLLRAEASVRRRLSADLEREGLSALRASRVLVVLTTAGGELELRALRARLRTSKANATEVVTTLEHARAGRRAAGCRTTAAPPRVRADGRAAASSSTACSPSTPSASQRRLRGARRGREALARARSAASWPPRRRRRSCDHAATAPWPAVPSIPSSRSPSSRSRCSSAGASATSSRESLRRREGAEPWVFYEGPPTANGRPGSHHVLARVFKDIYPRFKTMRGYYVERKGGWDCHGLPVEIAVEQQLGITLEGRDRGATASPSSTQQCRESVFEFLEDWNALTERIGFWVDLDDAYRTLDATYIESVWWALRQIWRQGPALRGPQGRALLPALRHRAVHPRGRARLPGRRRPVGLRALPGRRGRRPAAGRRRAAGVDDDAVDARLQRGGRGRPRADLRAREDRRARARRSCSPRRCVERVLGEDAEVLDRFPGAALDGVRYEPPFPFIAGARVRRARPHRPARRLRHRRRRHRHRAHRDRLRRGRLPPRRSSTG